MGQIDILYSLMWSGEKDTYMVFLPKIFNMKYIKKKKKYILKKQLNWNLGHYIRQLAWTVEKRKASAWKASKWTNEWWGEFSTMNEAKEKWTLLQ